MCKNVTTATDVAATVVDTTAVAITILACWCSFSSPESYKAMVNQIISVNDAKMKSYVYENIHISFQITSLTSQQ